MQVNETYIEKLTSIRNEFNTPIHANKVLLLVEGADDKKIFTNFFDANNVVIYFMDGKFFVEKALNDLNSIITNIIGIRDADFLHLENTPSPLANLFLTDIHDLELMMASNDASFMKFLSEYQTNPSLDIRHKILKSISFLGYLRWYNDIHNIGLSFEHIDFRKLYNALTFQFDAVKLTLAIVEKSPNAREKDSDFLINKANNLRNTAHDFFQLCNGHDFMKAIAQFVSNFTSKAISDTTAAKEFRLVYSTDNFKQTQLYRNTQAWASTNSCVLYKI
jgi:Protein of unknown function (DUF4435)